MKVQKFKGVLKETGEIVDNLQIYKGTDGVWFIKDLKWIDGAEYNALMYFENEFEKLKEYFEEL